MLKQENEHFILKILIGCAISGLFLWFIYAHIDWSETLNTLKNIHPWALFGISGLLVAFFWIKAIRWGYILRPITHKHAWQLFPVMMAGVMLNAAFSVIVGEILRAIMLGKQFQISKSSTLATVFVERLFDVLTLLIFLALAVVFTKLEYPTVRLVVLFGVAFLTTLIVFLVAMWHAPSIKALDLITRWMPHRIREIGLKRITLAIEGLASFTKPKLIANISFFSFLMWSVMCFANFLAIRSVNIDVPFSAAVVIVVINAFAIALPSSPGYIGIFEFGYIVGLSAYGIDSSQSLAGAIVYHGIYLITVAVIGCPSWYLIENNYNE